MATVNAPLCRSGMGIAIVAIFILFLGGVAVPAACAENTLDDLAFFASLEDRSAGAPDADRAADYILKVFAEAGLANVGAQEFLTPVPALISASLEIEGKTSEVYPWGPNLAALPMTPPEGVTGPLVYVGNGDLDRLNGKNIAGSIALMEMDSSCNWLETASLGASALIFIGDSTSSNGEFQEKNTPTPLAFPRFWVTPAEGDRLKQLIAERSVQATLKSRTTWRNKMVRNCYGFLPGKDTNLQKELIVLEASYDASSHILGLAPGADEAVSIAMLLSLVREFAAAPPDRPVLFLATVSNRRTISGMRQFIWATSARKKHLKQATKQIKAVKEKVDRSADILDKADPLGVDDRKEQEMLLGLLVEKAKDKADEIVRENQYRKAVSLSTGGGHAAEEEDPRPYRYLSYATQLKRLTPDQRALAAQLLNELKSDMEVQHRELKLRQRAGKSNEALKELMDRYTPVLYCSLYLSSHSPSVGLVELGDTYPIRQNVRRILRAGRLSNILSQAASDVSAGGALPNLLKTASRANSSQMETGLVQPGSHPSSDAAILAGLPAVALMTLDDARTLWSTPLDTLDRVDMNTVRALSRFVPALLNKTVSDPSLAAVCEPGIRGFASLEGQAMFVRQGELFPDQPAPGTIVSVIQGGTVFRGMVFQDGTFFIPGLANNRAALEKLIVEPYGIDPGTGRIAWTTDKVKTGKNNYRIKVKSDLAATNLIMFHCLQTDVLGIFNPQNMGHLTKVEILDAGTEAPPLRYWFSRIDGRDTMAVSVFLEKGTRFKLVLAESLLTKDFFLLNSSPEKTTGQGFLVGNPAAVTLTPYQVAADLSTLLSERLQNLARHGIANHYLEGLYASARNSLDRARDHYASKRYDGFWTDSVSAWATLDVVYNQVEKTQQDVLAGVMFFIALFVPFAYCMERYLFGFRSIYKQIAAFSIILVATILIIRTLHPAFQLTYNPMVVILAFFIVGLSLLVSWIIFMRFEKEMADLHSRTSHLKTPEVSKWQAFGAGFAIGVSNLGRRKLRTGLTCITLIILTFTVMSFTNVKSLHTTTHTRMAEGAPYRGVLIQPPYRLPLTALTLEDISSRYDHADTTIFPKAWVDPPGSADRTLGVASTASRRASLEGILGLGDAPPDSIRNLLKYGRWFQPGEDDAILLPTAVAQRLGLDPAKDLNAPVSLQGAPLKVIGYFDGSTLSSLKDLDNNPLTPAYMEVSQSEEMSEVEAEAIQSGEEILQGSGRFRNADADSTVIVPYATCIAFGGKLRTVAILPSPALNSLTIADVLSSWLAYPLFVGEDNATWYHSSNASLRYQGVSNLIVPILIVVFITLNTMIGHVHERKREIATYTSVGLAPTHVGFLFIVEALSLAVISTVIGYIVAQLSAKYLGNSAAFSQLTFNYSSLASIACMFLVFSVVFLAALYPARLAAEVAMPDVNRSWELPKAEGDAINMSLPFLLKSDEETGIMEFLHSFYASHQDTADESFIVDDADMDIREPLAPPGFEPPAACLVISTKVWLAPFDFGIKQHMQLHCCPSPENPGYLEIMLHMTRLSGERSAWFRANKKFIQTLRKQMLLWRLMDREAKAAYTERSSMSASSPSTLTA